MIKFIHPFIPTDQLLSDIQFPDTDPTGFVCQRDAFHQTAVNYLALFQIINIFNLRDVIERLLLMVSHYTDHQ
ncbi:Uncharacterised protein [Yersinia enterocolitica]|nr:Uncharacterised protein [Yersinia enterocolitica]